MAINGVAKGSCASELLSDIFSRAQLRLVVPRSWPSSEPWTAHSAPLSRDVAFYDEVLRAIVRLDLPNVPAYLPPPERGHAAYPLPLSLDEDDDAPLEERTEQARSTRLVLLALLFGLGLEIRGNYTSPRPPLPPGTASVPPAIAATPLASASGGVSVHQNHRPIPSISEQRDAPYQNQDGASSVLRGSDVAFFSVAWQGNKPGPLKSDVAPGNISRPVSSPRNSEDSLQHSQPATTSMVKWDQQLRRWTIEWQTDVPVVYARHTHPNPALLLTALMSLRLSPFSVLNTALTANLAGGSPYLALSASNQSSSSWADHDLLASLSSGPVYPDESPSQRAARAASALAKLPISNLPTKVLATQLVTPERSARDLGRKLSIRNFTAQPSDLSVYDKDDTDGGGQGGGDLTDLEGCGNSGSRRRSLSSANGRPSSRSYSTAGTGRKSMSAISTASFETDPATFHRSKDLLEESASNSAARSAPSWPDPSESDTVVTLYRSVITAMDVRSAVGVRMRTTMLEDADCGSAAAGRGLIICVEVENAAESGHLFDVQDVSLTITAPTSEEAKPAVARAEATLILSSDSNESESKFCLAQGEQRNLVYLVRFAHNRSGKFNDAATWCFGQNIASASRSVAIVVRGKPVLLHEDNPTKGVGDSSESDEASRLLTKEFSSTWNCTLDMTTLQEDLRRRIFAECGPMHALAAEVQEPKPVAPISVGGSLKHAPSSLAAAAVQDLLCDQEHMEMLEAHRVSPSFSMDRAAGTTASSLAGRTLAALSRSSPFSSGQVDRDPAYRLASIDMSRRDGQLPDAEMPVLCGVGLLAQAKLRAASARLVSQSITKDSWQHHSSTQRSSSASPGADAQEALAQAYLKSSAMGPRDRVRRSASALSETSTVTVRNRISSSSSTNLVTAASDREGGGIASRPLVIPLKDLSRLSPAGSLNYAAHGYFVTTKTHIRRRYGRDVGGDSHGSGLVPITASLADLDLVYVEVALVNQSTAARSFVVSWADGESKNQSVLSADNISRDQGRGAASSPGRPRTPVNRSPVLDATQALKRYISTKSAATLGMSRLLLPLENNVHLGPVGPGQSASCLLPLQSLAAAVDQRRELPEVAGAGRGRGPENRSQRGPTRLLLPLGDLLLRETASSVANRGAVVEAFLGAPQVLRAGGGSIYIGGP